MEVLKVGLIMESPTPHVFYTMFYHVFYTMFYNIDTEIVLKYELIKSSWRLESPTFERVSSKFLKERREMIRRLFKVRLSMDSRPPHLFTQFS